MNLSDQPIKNFLTEAVLSKGSKRVLADKKLVAELAATIRDDVMTNPSAFPAGSKTTFKKLPDQTLAEWVLEQIDDIASVGYEGVMYDREGTFNDWIVRRYIAGGHSWEDIVGVMNSNLRDWFILNKRNMLDANHRNVSSLKGVRDLGYLMTGHYEDRLKDLRNVAKFAAQDKMAKTIKLVDNDDYRIFTVLNRWGAVTIGRGTQWCTANSTTDFNFYQYASTGMLFQIFPYKEEPNPETGEPELVRDKSLAYQCDAGDRGPNFKNITDHDPSKEQIRNTYPFLYYDIKTALEANAAKIEAEIDRMAADPQYTKDKSFAPVPYNITEQISRLRRLVDRGWFTEQARSRQRAQGEEPEQGTPVIGAAPENNQQMPPQEPQMESIKQLAKRMLEDVTLGHIVRQFKPANTDQSYGNEPQDLEFAEDIVDECPELDAAKSRLAQALGGNSAMEEDTPLPAPDAGAADIGAQAATGGVGSMGGGGGGGGQYAPGTAPTMPESIQQKGITMEKIDKDVAAMLNSLKRYDKLNESVLGMVTLSMAKPTVVEAGPKKSEVPAAFRKEKGGDWKTSQKDLDKEESESPTSKKGLENLKKEKKLDEFYTYDTKEDQEDRDWKKKEKGDADKKKKEEDKSWRYKKTLDKKEDVKETADPEVLAWMARFAKLG